MYMGRKIWKNISKSECGFSLEKEGCWSFYLILYIAMLLLFLTTQKYFGKLVKLLKGENEISTLGAVANKSLFSPNGLWQWSPRLGARQEMKIFNLVPNLSAPHPGRNKGRKMRKRGLDFLLKP